MHSNIIHIFLHLLLINTSIHNITAVRYSITDDFDITSMPCSFETSKHYHRKLLTYTEKDTHKDLLTSEQFRKPNAQSHKIQQGSILTKHEITNENYNELWDDWGNWSICSVTCGSGRQVRWRHCLAENCTKGLKKAQIKACRLKDCSSKNILNWLGIKS